MKKTVSLILAILLVLSSAPFTSLLSMAVSNGYYNYVVLNGFAEIFEVNKDITGSVTIPSSLDGYSVSRVREGAFQNCTSLTGVTIPSCVQNIEKNTFTRCTSLKNITINNGVKSIGEFAFSNCTSLTSVSIPSSVNKIESSAFTFCSSLKSIAIPSGIKSIEDFTFHHCTSLTNISIPNTVTSIGSYAFSECPFSSISIPNSVLSISDSVFNSCPQLTTISIPDSVKNLGIMAFFRCSALKNIYIGKGVTNISTSCFDYCADLLSIDVSEDNDYYSSANGVLFNKTKTELIKYPEGKTELSYTIPNNVLSIGRGAFEKCLSLSIMSIPRNVTVIASDAFRGCKGLTKIYFNDKITFIGDYTFASCTSLNNVHIGNRITSIGAEAFSGCSSLANISLGTSVSSIGKDAFTNTAYYNDSNNWESGLLYIGNNLIKANKNDLNTNCIIKSGTNCIADNAFEYCSSMSKISIPDGLTNIGKCSFLSCNSLEVISLPFSIVNIDSTAFEYCSTLKRIEINNEKYCSIDGVLFNKGATELIIYPKGKSETTYTVPESVTVLGDCSFFAVNNLKNINISDGVTRIGKGAFEYCSGLTNITIPNSVKSLGSFVFHSCSALTNIKIGNGITRIENCSFSYCRGLISINIPSNITSIGNSAFSDCDSLKKVIIPNSITSFGEYVFSGSNYITEILFLGTNTEWASLGWTPPNSWTKVFYGAGTCGNNLIYNITNSKDMCELTINGTGKMTAYASSDDSPFAGCSLINHIVVKNGVTSISANAFSDCTGLTSVTLPSSLTTIGKDSFTGCTGLTKTNYLGTIDNWVQIAFGNANANPVRFSKNLYINGKIITNASITNAPTIKFGVFYGCESLTSINIGNSVSEIKKSAFARCPNLKTITLTKNVTTVGEYVYYLCDQLSDVYFFGNQNDWNTISIGKDNTNFQNATIHFVSIPHEHNYISEITKAKTCAETGEKTFTCIGCGDVYIETIPKSEIHSWDSGTIVKDVSCTDAGIKKYTCTVCNISKNETITATGHNYAKKTISTVSCTSDGINQYTCLNCHDIYTEVITAHGHNIVVDEAVEPTCTTSGLTEGQHCSTCSAVLIPQKVVSALGHSERIIPSVAATCENNGMSQGKYCYVCGQVTQTQTVIPKLEHQFNAGFLEPSSQTAGEFVKKYTCLHCGFIMSELVSITDGAEIEVGTITAEPGTTVYVPVSIDNNPGIMGYKLTVKYNPDHLTPKSVEYADTISSGLQDNIDGNMVPGSINIYWYGDENNTLNGTMFYVVFSVDSSAVGVENIGLTYSQGDTFDEEYNDVYINCNSGQIEYELNENRPSIALEPVKDTACADDIIAVNLSLKNSFNFDKCRITLDLSSGMYSYVGQNIGTKSLKEVMTSSSDIITLELTGDVQKDDIIATVFLKPTQESIGKTLDISAEIACKSDAGNYVQADVENCSVTINNSAQPEPYTVNCEFPKAVVKGSTFDVPIKISNNNGIMGYRLSFKYDASIMSPVSVTDLRLLGGTLNNNIGSKPGEFDLVWYANEQSTSNGTIATLRFTALESSTSAQSVLVSSNTDDTFDEQYNDVVFNCISNNFSIINSNECIITADFSATSIMLNSNFVTTPNSECDLSNDTVGTVNSIDFNTRMVVNGNKAVLCFSKPGTTKLTVNINNVTPGEVIDITDLVNSARIEHTLFANGDVNNDDVVDISDISNVLQTQNYGLSTETARDKTADVNGDGIIDISDLSIILFTKNYGVSSVSV